jgi:predicted DNA-binding transcriptional regulator AlpA
VPADVLPLPGPAAARRLVAASPPDQESDRPRTSAPSLLVPLALRAAQAAPYCGVSEATWWRWDTAGKIPRGRKLSRGVKVWCRLELEAWAAAGFPSRQEWEAMGRGQNK